MMPRKVGALRSKFNNRRTEWNGRMFDSAGEKRRAQELVLLERAGHIQGLEFQPVYEFVVDGIHVCRYRADFRYIANGELVVEDYKGVVTDLYRIKRNLMLACHGIRVFESRAQRKAPVRRVRRKRA